MPPGRRDPPFCRSRARYRTRLYSPRVGARQRIASEPPVLLQQSARRPGDRTDSSWTPGPNAATSIRRHHWLARCAAVHFLRALQSTTDAPDLFHRAPGERRPDGTRRWPGDPPRRQLRRRRPAGQHAARALGGFVEAIGQRGGAPESGGSVSGVTSSGAAPEEGGGSAADAVRSRARSVARHSSASFGFPHRSYRSTSRRAAWI